MTENSNNRHSVSSRAESELRKLPSDWSNSPTLIKQIYNLFLGYLKDQVKPESRRAPANTRIRLKLMPLLLRSREAAKQFPSCMQVCHLPVHWIQILMGIPRTVPYC